MANFVTREEFNNLLSQERASGGSGQEAVNYVYESYKANNGNSGSNSSQSNSNQYARRNTYTSPTKTWNASSYKGSQRQYDRQYAAEALRNISKVTTDKQLAKLINKHVGSDAKKDTFWGQTKSSYDIGVIGELMNQAYGKYRDSVSKNDPNASSYKAIADAYSLLADYYQDVNREALDDENVKAKWISQDMARYAPQFIEQTKAGGPAMAVGAGVGAGLGALAGILIPTVGEEAATTTGGALAGRALGGAISKLSGGLLGKAGGAIAGTKVGAISGTAAYSYNTMAGAAMKNLTDAGIDEQTAAKAARDEAIISSAIESLDTAVDLIAVVPGVGSAMKKLEVEALKKGAGAYLSNIAQEYGEEFVQEAISMANERRARNGQADSGITGLLSEVRKVVAEMATPEGRENLERAREAGRGGGIIGGFMAPIGGAINNVITAPAQNAMVSAVNNLETNPVVRQINNEITSYQKDPGKARAAQTMFEQNADKYRSAQEGMTLFDAEGTPVAAVTGRTEQGVTMRMLDNSGPATVVFTEDSGFANNPTVNSTLTNGGYFANEAQETSPFDDYEDIPDEEYAPMESEEGQPDEQPEQPAPPEEPVPPAPQPIEEEQQEEQQETPEEVPPEAPQPETAPQEEQQEDIAPEITPEMEEAERAANATETARQAEEVARTVEKTENSRAVSQPKQETTQKKPRRRKLLTSEGRILQKDVNRLNRENNSLRERVAELSRQMRPTEVHTANSNDVRKVTRDLIHDLGSKANIGETTEKFQRLSDYIIQHSGQEMDYNEIERMADDIAADILDNITIDFDSPNAYAAKELLDSLKREPIRVDKQLLAELGFDSMKELREKYPDIRFSTKSKRGVDQAYQDNASYILGEDPANSQGQLEAMQDTINSGKTTTATLFDVEGNEYYNQMLTEISNRVIDTALGEDVRETAPTYADKQKAKYDKLKSDDARKLNEVKEEKNRQLKELRDEKNAKIDELRAEKNKQLNELREAKNKRIAEIRKLAIESKREAVAKERAAKWEKAEAITKHYKDVMERKEQRRRTAGIRKKIQKLTKDISNRLLKPKEGKYVPQDMVKAAVELLESIDQNTGSESSAERINKLFAEYNKLMADPEYGSVFTDEVTQARLQDLAEVVGGTRLNDMSEDQLNRVFEVVRSMAKNIDTAVKIRIGNENNNAFQMGKDLVKETEAAKGWGKGFLGKANEGYNTASLRPTTFFERLAGFKKDSTWGKMGKLLNDGQLKTTTEKVRGLMKFSSLLNDKKSSTLRDTVSLGKDASGEDINISRGMMLSLYMHLQNDSNIRHIKYGGLTIPGIEDYYKGKNDNGFGTSQGRALGISPELRKAQDEYKAIVKEYNAIDAEEVKDLDWQERIDDVVQRMDDKQAEIDSIYEKGDDYIGRLRENIEKQLTDYDKKWISTTQEYMKEAQEVLNATTLETYGFKKALVENYFPIETDKDFRAAQFENISKNMSLENSGFMKDRVTSSNPILLLDISEVVDRYIDNSSKYVGLMPAIRSFEKVYGKTMPGYENSVQKALDTKFGKSASKYIGDLLGDLTGANKSNSDFLSTFFAKTRGNLAQAVLSLNPRVAFSQSASYMNAASEIGWKPLLEAFGKGKNPSTNEQAMELVTKYSPLEYYRSIGNSIVELGDIKNDARMQNRILKKFDFLMNWISQVDTATVGRLWYAAESYVSDNNSSLEHGTDEYYQEVAKVYNRIIERSQPNYTTMQRPGILRSPNDLTKSLTMFMTQRLQNYNILYEAGERLARYESDFKNNANDVTEADVKKARTDMARAITSQIASTASLVLFKAGIDAIMHNMKGYRDDDEELTADSISLKLMDMFCDSLTGNFLLGNEAYTFSKSLLTGSHYYGITVNGIDTFTSILSEISEAVNASDDKKLEKWGNLAGTTAQLFGIPLENAEKIVDGIKRHAEDIQNGEFLSYNSGKKKANLTVDFNYDDKNMLNNVVRLFSKKQKTDVEKEIEGVYKETNEKSVYPNIDAVKKLSYNGDDYDLTEAEQDRYRKTAGKTAESYIQDLIDSSVYQTLTDKQKAQAIREMYSYAKDDAKAEFFDSRDIDFQSSMQNLLTGVDKAGTTNDRTALSMENLADYISFKTAYDSSVKDGDYKSIDKLVSQYSRLNQNTRTVLSERAGNLDNLLEYKNLGMGSQVYYTVKQATNDAQSTLDINANTGTLVRLLGLSNAKITDKQRDTIITKVDGYIGSNGKAAYSALTKYGFNVSDVYTFFNTALNCKTWKNNGEPADQNGVLKPDTVAFALSQLPGLTEQQRAAIYNDIKSQVSSKFNDWGNYSYQSEISYIKNKSKANYAVPKGKPKSTGNPLYDSMPKAG